MGRNAKLKQARREGSVVKKEPVYNMTQTQLDAYVADKVMKFKADIAEEITDKVASTLLVQSFDVLNTYFKFGNLRLKRFRYYIDKLSVIISDMVKENPKWDYISETVSDLEERGIDVTKLLSGKITEHELRRRSDMEKLCPKINLEVNVGGKEKAEADS